MSDKNMSQRDDTDRGLYYPSYEYKVQFVQVYNISYSFIIFEQNYYASNESLENHGQIYYPYQPNNWQLPIQSGPAVVAPVNIVDGLGGGIERETDNLPSEVVSEPVAGIIGELL